VPLRTGLWSWFFGPCWVAVIRYLICLNLATLGTWDKQTSSHLSPEMFFKTSPLHPTVSKENLGLLVPRMVAWLVSGVPPLLPADTHCWSGMVQSSGSARVMPKPHHEQALCQPGQLSPVT
jgi:hypothetical protein